MKKLGLTLNRADAGTEAIQVTQRLKLYGCQLVLSNDSG